MQPSLTHPHPYPHPHPQQFQMPFDPTSSHDDFLEQMLSSLNNNNNNHPPSSPFPDFSDPSSFLKPLSGNDDHLATKFRHHQINTPSPAAAAKALMLHQQLMLNGNGVFPAPLSLGNNEYNDDVEGSSLKSISPGNDSFVQALFNGFTGSPANPPQHFNHIQVDALNQAAPPSGSTGGGGGSGAPAQARQPRVRARRGQATDPHSIAERLRRERIAERMKALQELVPNANKTDKASMLDEIIDYVKFLQLQVKVLSMSRLGGATAVAPLVADMSSEAGGDGGRANRTQTASSPNNDNAMTVTEHQVVKLMEEDMGSAMQYLQGKGLCLMPISLATAISTATCHSRNIMNPLLGSNGCGDPSGPSSPNMSVLSVQSATMANGAAEASVKDATSN